MIGSMVVIIAAKRGRRNSDATVAATPKGCWKLTVIDAARAPSARHSSRTSSSLAAWT